MYNKLYWSCFIKMYLSISKDCVYNLLNGILLNVQFKSCNYVINIVKVIVKLNAKLNKFILLAKIL